MIGWILIGIRWIGISLIVAGAIGVLIGADVGSLRICAGAAVLMLAGVIVRRRWRTRSQSWGRRSTMVKGMHYHTNSREYPPELQSVHHDHDECPDGKRIKLEHKTWGDGGKPRCKECIRLS
jgi:hypothetical protein